jgi:hypothetical protein
MLMMLKIVELSESGEDAETSRAQCEAPEADCRHSKSP